MPTSSAYRSRRHNGGNVATDSNREIRLAKDWGFEDPGSMLEAYGFEPTVPAICSRPECDYSTLMEPDQRNGWCEDCGDNTVRSFLVLMGVI